MAYTTANIAGAVSQADADNQRARLSDLQLRQGEQNLAQGSRVADLQLEGAQMDMQSKKRGEALKQIEISGKLAEDVLASGGKNFPQFQATLQQLGVPPENIPKQFDPDEIQRFVGNYKALMNQQEQMKGLPSSVQETEIFRSKPKDWQETHMGLKRADKTLNLGDRQVVLDPSGGVRNSYKVKPSPEQMPDFRAKVAAAEAQAKETGKATGAAQSGLGSALDDIEKMRFEVKGLLESPGFDIIYGKSRLIDPRSYDMGGPAAGSEARRKQLEASSFAISIKKMQGLGALSDAEGKKMSEAFSRASIPNQGEEDARQAWKEVFYYLDLAEQRVKEKASGKPAATAPPRSNSPITVDW